MQWIYFFVGLFVGLFFLGFVIDCWYRNQIGKPVQLRDIFNPDEEVDVVECVRSGINFFAFVRSPEGDSLRVADISNISLPKQCPPKPVSGKYRYKVVKFRKASGQLRTEETLVEADRVDIIA
jgi:hypothetical protein